MDWLSVLLRRVVGLLLVISLTELLLPAGSLERFCRLVFGLLLAAAVVTSLPGLEQAVNWGNDLTIPQADVGREYVEQGQALAEELAQAVQEQAQQQEKETSGDDLAEEDPGINGISGISGYAP